MTTSLPEAPSTTTTRTKRQKRARRSQRVASQNDAATSPTSTMVPQATRENSPLTSLPAELIMEIACQLDNRSYIMLAIAWRHFLHAYAQGLDPWNPARRRLKDVCSALQRGLDWKLVHVRYRDDTGPTPIAPGSSWMREGKEDFVIKLLVKTEFARRDEDASVFPALYDYMSLDGYRRHYETPLFVKTISVFLPIAARASTAIYNDRLSRRVDVIDVDQQQTLKVPPFKICANLLKEYWNLSGLRFPTSAPELEAMCKALSVPMTLITDFCFSLDIPVLDLIMPHVCSALAAGTSRLRHIAIQDGDPPVKLVDAITKGCRHLDLLEVSVSSRPTAEAVARAIRGLPALTCINLATSDFRDGTTLVEPIADAIGASTSLAEILITECKLGVNGAEYLFKALRGNTVVRSLDLSDNPDIGDTGACALAELVLLQQKSNKEGVHAPSTLLTRLSLQDTGITTRGALALAEAFAASLQTSYHVELEENRLGREGRFAMFQLKHDLKHVGEFTTDDYDEDEDEDWDADSWDEDSDEEGRDDDDEDDEYDEDGDD